MVHKKLKNVVVEISLSRQTMLVCVASFPITWNQSCELDKSHFFLIVINSSVLFYVTFFLSSFKKECQFIVIWNNLSLKFLFYH